MYDASLLWPKQDYLEGRLFMSQVDLLTSVRISRSSVTRPNGPF